MAALLLNRKLVETHDKSVPRGVDIAELYTNPSAEHGDQLKGAVSRLVISGC